MQSNSNEYNIEPKISENITPKKPTNVRIMTYNVHGFNSRNWKSTYADILRQIKLIDPDIFGLQEIHLGCPDHYRMKEIAEDFKDLGYILRFSKCYVNALASKYDFDTEEIDLGCGRCAIIGHNFKMCHNDLVVCTTHLEVADIDGEKRIQQIKKIINAIANMNVTKSIIIGDFNSLRKADYTDSEWLTMQLIDGKRRVETSEDVIPIIEENGYQDSFVCANIKTPNVSVWSNRRVDYSYGQNMQFIVSGVVETGLSDHYPIYADF